MASPLSQLLEEVSREHFPYPPATAAEIDEFEQGRGLPTGLEGSCLG